LADGGNDGGLLGAFGAVVGVRVLGAAVGLIVGTAELGANDGFKEGQGLGACVEIGLGAALGLLEEGRGDGCTVFTVGSAVGVRLGFALGARVG